MSDPNDNSIPVLNEILVPGHRTQTRPASNEAAAEPSVQREPSFASRPALAPEAQHAQEPVFAPRPSSNPAPVLSPEGAGEAASAGVFDRAEPAAPLEAGATVPPDIAREGAAQVSEDLDADAIAERLRGRFAGFLTGEGRGIVEARCREALQDHTTWLVNQITREVALTLETELTGWVREAVAEEFARRAKRN